MAKRRNRTKATQETSVLDPKRVAASPIEQGPRSQRNSSSPVRNVVPKRSAGPIQKSEGAAIPRLRRVAEIPDFLMSVTERRAIPGAHIDAHQAASKQITPNREGRALPKWGDFKPQKQTALAQTKKVQEHDSSTKLRDAPTCKPRPQPLKGMGNSRDFIPWCDIKR